MRTRLSIPSALIPFALCILIALGGCAGGPRLADQVASPYRSPGSLAEGEILHVATGRLLTHDELLEHLAPFPVVYVGESHDSVDDHAVQLQILQGLHQRFPGGVAVGMEMLRRPFQADVDAYLRGEVGEKEFLRVWQKNWGPRSYPYYRDILQFIKDNHIPLLALNAGRDLVGAMRGGEGELAPEMAERLPEMVEDSYQNAFLAGIFGGHGEGAGHSEAFRRIQVLWDETMAQTAAGYLTGPAGQGKRLLVFAGGNHVRYGFGIPRRVFRRHPVPYVIVDPYTVELPADKQDKLMDVDLPELPMPSAHVYWAVGYEDLEDQQVMLGVRIEETEDKSGVRVLGVVPESPGAKAGIQDGDLIVAVDEDPVREVFDLTYRVGQHKPGETGSVQVRRGEETLTLPVTYHVVEHGTK